MCVDDPGNVAEIEAAAAKAGVTLDVLVEIDVGAKRCGIAPGVPAARLAKQIANSPHLTFAGLQAYQGSAQHVRKADTRRDQIARAVEMVEETLRALRAAGLEARIVGGGGTGTYEIEAASRVYNELQCGSYIFMDADYARNKRADGGLFDAYEHALFICATVMSMPAPERAVVDAGLKTFSVDSGMPLAWKLAGALYHRPSDEHGILDLTNCTEPPNAATRCCWCPATATPPSTCTTGTSACAASARRLRMWKVSGPWPPAALCSEFVRKRCAALAPLRRCDRHPIWMAVQRHHGVTQ